MNSFYTQGNKESLNFMCWFLVGEVNKIARLISRF